jgi:hypothetical protein
MLLYVLEVILMKKYLISSIVVLAVLAVTWVAFAQPQGDFRERMAQMREAQMKAIEMIQQQAMKIKESFAAPRSEGQNLQDMSEEERAKFREQRMKQRDEQQAALAAIEQQIMVLKGRRVLQQEHEASITELQELQALAKKENAAETAKRIEDIIAKKNKTFEETMQKLGLPEMPGRPGQGQGPGSGPGQQP